ncbi:hypothetical protein PIB30_019832 [Stylosanthes scabra]|uniref:Uncharacterized protein n=1 Tax=Stylosanthes scabra TaxID=79078 RepID=A0ABU6R8L0_9FABA|nr:hypothetical protein [Stylosanthes scabra]
MLTRRIAFSSTTAELPSSPAALTTPSSPAERQFILLRRRLCASLLLRLSREAITARCCYQCLPTNRVRRGFCPATEGGPLPPSLLIMLSCPAAAGTPIPGKGVVTYKFPADPTVALGYLSFAFLIVSTVAGYMSLFYPYKGKSVPQGQAGQGAIQIIIVVRDLKKLKLIQCP